MIYGPKILAATPSRTKPTKIIGRQMRKSNIVVSMAYYPIVHH